MNSRHACVSFDSTVLPGRALVGLPGTPGLSRARSVASRDKSDMPGVLKQIFAHNSLFSASSDALLGTPDSLSDARGASRSPNDVGDERQSISE